MGFTNTQVLLTNRQSRNRIDNQPSPFPFFISIEPSHSIDPITRFKPSRSIIGSISARAYNGQEYDTRNTKDASVINIVERYNDTQELMSSELDDKSLSYFIDWLINNVVFVEIITYSDDDAYTIFETMNDRGLSSPYPTWTSQEY
jgi:hypothetical protein